MTTSSSTAHRYDTTPHSNSSTTHNRSFRPTHYNPVLSYSGERSGTGLPPSLWMSPVSTTPTRPGGFPNLNDNSGSLLATEPLHTTEPSTSSFTPTTESKSSFFSALFSDEVFNTTGPSISPEATSPFASPRVSGSPTFNSPLDPGVDPDKMAREDPLATQVWKMYARQKASLPHAHRMENLTWRMMALALKKKKGEEEAVQRLEAANRNHDIPSQLDVPPSQQGSDDTSEGRDDQGERGRRIDKGKTKVRVVGFDGTNQDGPEEDE